MKPPPLPGLNLLRVLASLYIVVFHLGASALPLPTFFMQGASATSLFFMLSGFLLAHTTGPAPMSEPRQRRFVWRRLARLMPANLLGIGFAVMCGALLPLLPTHLDRLPESLLLVQNWVVGDTYGVVTPAWSMGCLLFFYLCQPLLLPRLARLGTRRLVSVLAALWLAGGLLPLLLARVPGVFDPSDWQVYLHTSPLTRLPEFIIGLGLRVLVRRHGLPAHWVKGSWPGAAVPLVGLLTVVLMNVLPFNLPVNNGLYAPLTAVLLLAFVQPAGWLARLGDTPLARRLASATLCIYVLHVTWMHVFGLWVLPRLGLPWNGLAVTLYLLTVLGSSMLADALLCRPLTGWLSRLGTRRQEASQPAPAPAVPALQLPLLTRFRKRPAHV